MNTNSNYITKNSEKVNSSVIYKVSFEVRNFLYKLNTEDREKAISFLEETLLQEELFNKLADEKEKIKMIQFCLSYSKQYSFVEKVGSSPAVVHKELTEDGSYEFTFIKLDDFHKSKTQDKLFYKEYSKKGSNTNSILFSKWWIDCLNRKITPKFSSTEFNPSGKLNPDKFNYWQGFVEAKKGDVKPFIDHIDKLIDGTLEEKLYIIKLIGYTVKYPDVNVGTAIVLKGKQGSGKTTISETIRKMCPKHSKYVENLDQLLMGFNGEYIHTKYFLHEESVFSNDHKLNEKIKPMITGTKRQIRIKHLTPITIDNFSFHIFTSNRDNPIKVEENDRRFNVFNTTDTLIKNREYFKNYYKWLDNGGANALVYFFKNKLKLDDFDFSETISNKAKDSVKVENLDPVKMFLYNIMTGDFPIAIDPNGEKLFTYEQWQKKPIDVPKRSFYYTFLLFNKELGRNIQHLNNAKFFRIIWDIFQLPEEGIKNWVKNGYRFVRLPSLDEAKVLLAKSIGSSVSNIFDQTKADNQENNISLYDYIMANEVISDDEQEDFDPFAPQEEQEKNNFFKPINSNEIEKEKKIAECENNRYINIVSKIKPYLDHDKLKPYLEDNIEPS